MSEAPKKLTEPERLQRAADAKQSVLREAAAVVKKAQEGQRLNEDEKHLLTEAKLLIENSVEGSGGAYEVGEDGALSFTFSKEMLNQRAARVAAEGGAQLGEEVERAAAEVSQDPLDIEIINTPNDHERFLAALDGLKQVGREDLFTYFTQEFREDLYQEGVDAAKKAIQDTPQEFGGPEGKEKFWRWYLLPIMQAPFHQAYACDAVLSAYFPETDNTTDNSATQSIAALRVLFKDRVLLLERLCQKVGQTPIVPKLLEPLENQVGMEGKVSAQYGASRALRAIPEIKKKLEPHISISDKVVVDIYEIGMQGPFRNFNPTVFLLNPSEWS